MESGPLPAHNHGNQIGALRTAMDLLEERLRRAEQRLLQYPPLLLQAYDLNGNPRLYSTLAQPSGGDDAAPSTSFPFAISVRPAPGSPGAYQAMVNPDSTVMVSSQPNDNLGVTGLGTWFPFIANDLIALYIVVSNLTAQSATIQSYGMGTTTFDPTLAAWGTGDNTYVFNDGMTPPSQIGINILLGYSTPDGQGKPYLIQTQFNHVLLENCSIDGYPAIYDFSHRERYGITAPTS